MFDREGRLAIVMEVKNDSPRDRPLITFFDSVQRPSATIGYPSFMLMPDAPDVQWNNEDPMIAFLGKERGVLWHAPTEIVGPWKDVRLIQ